MTASNWQRTGSLNLLSLGTGTQCSESNWLSVRAAAKPFLTGRWPWPRNWCYVLRLRLRTSDQSNVAARPAKIASRWLHLPSPPQTRLPFSPCKWKCGARWWANVSGCCGRLLWSQAGRDELQRAGRWWQARWRRQRRGEAMAGWTERATERHYHI